MAKTYCDDCTITHTPLMCFKKPRRPIKQISDKKLTKKQETDRLWYELNPPNEQGVWFCYLNIAPDCQIKVTRITINLEHVLSKTRHHELEFVVDNLRPACQPCNSLKGSKDWVDGVGLT